MQTMGLIRTRARRKHQRRLGSGLETQVVVVDGHWNLLRVGKKAQAQAIK
jgi:hypothetical protein